MHHPKATPRGAADFIPWMEARRGEIPWAFHWQRQQHQIRIFLEGLHPAIAITVTAHALCVTVEQDGEILDTLLWLEMSPSRRGSAYVCTLCEPACAKRFASLGKMRADHLYAPFLDWCQKTLAHATHLELLRAPEVTAAKLVKNLREQPGRKSGTLLYNPYTKKKFKNQVFII